MRCAWVMYFVLLWAASSGAQVRVITEAQCDSAFAAAKQVVPFPLRLVLPSFVTDGYALRAFIESDEFNAIRHAMSDRETMDEIYNDARTLRHGDETTSLLVSVFGTIEHERLPLHTLLGEIDVPLSTESHAAFRKRLGHLPRHIYSPADDDRDKLQHFFASAWLKRAIGVDWLVRAAGTLVESIENAFVIEGARDPRDIHANLDGIRFGVNADDPDALPSMFLSANP